MPNHASPPTAFAVDRRVQRTRDALRVALMQLMVDVGWDAIDVQSLCQQANIGRSTFYQHYTNKEELLIANFEALRMALLAQAGVQAKASAQALAQPAQRLAFVPGLVAHVYDAQHVFRALLGRRSGQYVQDRFRELLVQMVRSDAPQGIARTWPSDAAAHYLGGALYELLVWWLGHNRPQRPQEIAAIYEQWSQPVLAMVDVPSERDRAS